MLDQGDPLQQSGPAHPDGGPSGSEDRLLRLFVGPNADTFIRIHRRMQDARAKRLRMNWFGVNWVVLFVPIAWFFYRKMFLAGAAILLVPPILIFVFPQLATVSMGGLAGMLVVLSNRWYIERALRKIQKIEALDLPPNERDARIRQSGGTSIFGACLGGSIYAAFIAILFVPDPTIARASPPLCDHPEIQALVTRLAYEKYLVTVRIDGEKPPLSNFAMVDERFDPPRRRCRAALVADTRTDDVFFSITWQDESELISRVLVGPTLKSISN